ncbi:16S rRNA (guanine(1207)-N(2))-methyltransferase RsmC [Candidatus Fukatsuia anoeciicola]|uniref:16S rRNA (guanine(1207)-N(2))-methyltransferase RsmC n=1 Tax=Candidatus Fukatsuia anoeciicola TaxID=2994492 RepID=UPI003463EE3C
MLMLTTTSKMLLRHRNEFAQRSILFAGNLQDDLPAKFKTIKTQVHTSQYNYWQTLKDTLEKKVQFSLLANKNIITDCNTLLYFWPKSKQEAAFQLSNLLSLLVIGSDIFIIGENRSGVRSVEKILTSMIKMRKIDSAYRCRLYYGRLDKQVKFNYNSWWYSYQVSDTIIKTLPGVFSRNHLDAGSQLLLSTFKPNLEGSVLDIASGSGVLAAVLAKNSPKIKLILSDVSAAAIEASRVTLSINNINAKVIASNLYSDIDGYFDLIISNPPFHERSQTCLRITDRLIRDAKEHLNTSGKLRIVANAFLPYSSMLDAVFGSHEILAQNSRFKVYQATLSRNIK